VNEGKESTTSSAFERRLVPRFSIRLPVTILTGGQDVIGLTSDMSDNGFSCYIDAKYLELLAPSFECIIDLPPEVTHSVSRRIYCKAQLLRTKDLGNGETLVAAKILQYDF
jgi:hypothetical protein